MSSIFAGAFAATPSSDVRRISIALTSLIAGAAGALIAYWTWRMVLAASATPAAAPWWLPTTIAGIAAAVLWAVLASHARRMSLVAGAAAIVLVSILIFPVAALCTEFAAATANGFPPVMEFVAALPALLAEALRVTFVNLLYCGLVTVPIAAVVGLLLAAFGRLIAFAVERMARRREPVGPSGP